MQFKTLYVSCDIFEPNPVIWQDQTYEKLRICSPSNLFCQIFPFTFYYICLLLGTMNKQRFNITCETKDNIPPNYNNKHPKELRITVILKQDNKSTPKNMIGMPASSNRYKSTSKELQPQLNASYLTQTHFKSERLKNRYEKDGFAKSTIYDQWRGRVGDEPIMLPLMDPKHYQQLLNHSRTDARGDKSEREKLQFATIYVENNQPPAERYSFRKSPHLISNRLSKIGQDESRFKVERLSLANKKQSSIQQSKQLKQSKQCVHLQLPKQKLSQIGQYTKQNKNKLLSQSLRLSARQKSTPVQRLRSKYEHLQKQVDGSGWQWMSKWVLGRRLVLPQ